jgi:manganese/iron transport system permease protein/iron/zinc/copper transport system permease protein
MDLLSPYQFEFFRNGVVAATIAGALCGLLGVYVVQRGMSYIGHGLAHALFGGFAASSLIGVNVVAGAGAWGIGSALTVTRVARRRGIGDDAAIGVVTTASFALGLALLSIRRGGVDVEAALFGSVLGVSTAEVWLVAAVAVLAGALVLTCYRQLLFCTFDPEVAQVSGVRVVWFDTGLTIVLALAILATLNVLGVTLVAAGLVTPAVTARLVTHSFPRVLAVSTTTGAIAGFVGLNASYHLDIPSGPAVVLTSTALLIVAAGLAALRPPSPRLPRR